MATEALKSTSITNYDANTAVTTGKGANGTVRVVDDYVTTTSGVTTGSTYKMCRIPSNCIVKAVKWEAEAMTAGTFDVGLSYSDSTNDGTQQSLAGTVISAGFFATATSAASAVTADTDITNESGTYTLAKRTQPIWQAAGLSTDPGGFFDVVFTSTATITTGARMGCKIHYID